MLDSAEGQLVYGKPLMVIELALNDGSPVTVKVLAVTPLFPWTVTVAGCNEYPPPVAATACQVGGLPEPFESHPYPAVPADPVRSNIMLLTLMVLLATI